VHPSSLSARRTSTACIASASSHIIRERHAARRSVPRDPIEGIAKRVHGLHCRDALPIDAAHGPSILSASMLRGIRFVAGHNVRGTSTRLRELITAAGFSLTGSSGRGFPPRSASLLARGRFAPPARPLLFSTCYKRSMSRDRRFLYVRHRARGGSASASAGWRRPMRNVPNGTARCAGFSTVAVPRCHSTPLRGKFRGTCRCGSTSRK
jgi:hypothetical protein